MGKMEEELSAERCKEILIWNYHGIPKGAFTGHKERFEKAKAIDDFLAEEHRRFIQEIARYSNEGRIESSIGFRT
ncbi:MAG TPA: hypothetical protein VLH13_03665 [Methanomassiliicoccales archaeon]|nr:hypothetical protein [Methanomassiliicoccales archaeon]